MVDRISTGISRCRGDLVCLYEYAGLTSQGGYQLNTVSDALYDRIRNAFASGHSEAWRICRTLQTDLIREHVFLKVPLDPYFEVLSHIRDALLARRDNSSTVVGDWETAIHAAKDHIEVSGFRTTDHRRLYRREFAVADAAYFLRQQGYKIRLEPGLIDLEDEAETALVAEIENTVARLGGLNVARKLFFQIASTYDPILERYQIIPHTSMTGGGQPLVPWGYLVQLAAKHIDGEKPYLDINSHWQRLLNLATAYAAILDVQPYTPTSWASFDAKSLLKYLQQQALFDSTYRFMQLRPSDVVKLCRGVLNFLTCSEPTRNGWSIDEALDVISFLVSPARGERGPIIISAADVKRALPYIPKDRIEMLLSDVFAHPSKGPNQGFSRLTDAPLPTDKSKGADFYLKPLIRRPKNRFLVVDRSLCGWGYLEALLTALRPNYGQFDDKVGLAVEEFLKAELASHGVLAVGGDYDLNGAHGECDIVAETDQTLFFMELKKKSLTRRAKAGSDADLLLDLAGSLLAAQAQAGWHELRIKTAGSLDLVKDGARNHIQLNGRGIEKIAIGLMDFGSFQDRILLKQFMEATLIVSFGSPDPEIAKKFQAINEALDDIRAQYTTTHRGKSEVHQPFFNCWFISVPQLLVFLDGVSDPDSFRRALWSCRHIVTGTSDLYFEIARMRNMQAAVARSMPERGQNS